VSEQQKKKRWALVAMGLGAGTTVALLVGLAVFAGIGSAAAQAVPKNTAPPTISGGLVEGQTLTSQPGTWTGTQPITFASQWLRCDRDGGSCSAIIGATRETYRLTSADVNTTLRIRVTATNKDGSATVTSAHTGVVAAKRPPATAAPPTVSGTAVEGQTLTSQPGTWTGTQPITFTSQWLRCDRSGNNCSAIIGATNQTYRLGTTDVGTTARVRVTATNKDGSGAATSAATAVISTAPPPTGCPSGPGPVPVTSITPPARLVLDQMQFSPSIIQRTTPQVTARFHVSNTCGQAVQGALVYANAVPFNQLSLTELPTGADGWVQLTFQTLRGFPATSRQERLVLFVRLRKPGENVLVGISNRRLVSVRVDLSQ
jgi:hypothetical protein